MTKRNCRTKLLNRLWLRETENIVNKCFFIEEKIKHVIEVLWVIEYTCVVQSDVASSWELLSRCTLSGLGKWWSHWGWRTLLESLRWFRRYDRRPIYQTSPFVDTMRRGNCLSMKSRVISFQRYGASRWILHARGLWEKERMFRWKTCPGQGSNLDLCGHNSAS